MGSRIFKTQKEYIRHLRWRRRVTKIITIFSGVLLFLYIVVTSPRNLSAWLLFSAYTLLMVFLDYQAKREFLKEDTETAKKEAQEKLARENSKRIRKYM